MTKWIVFICLLLASQLSAATEKVVVLSSYPQEVISQFEAAFEQKYPQYRLEILWRQSRDTMNYLHQPHSPVDVYWTLAQRNFAVLAKEGTLRKLNIDLSGLPRKIGGFEISDPDGYYVAHETAGYGMAYHPAELQRLGLPVPTDWKSLADPAFDGHVVMPIPSKVGYAPMLVDTLLQGYGWERGWEMLTRVAANASLADAGATFISDDVGGGRFAVGMTMDFFAVSAIANGKPLRFTYPEKVGYSPAHIASYDYDVTTGLTRQELIGALFDALITRRHAALKTMWAAIRLAESKSPSAGKPELSTAQLDATEFYHLALAAPQQRNTDDPLVRHGAKLFGQAQCDACHTPQFQTGDFARYPALSRQTIRPYTDLLLHDMGESLADHRPNFLASGREWRTPPLWGIGLAQKVEPRAGFLHDGRARTLLEAVLWHDSEGRAAARAVQSMTPSNRRDLLKFLESL